MFYNEFKLATSIIVCYQPTLTKYNLKNFFQSKKFLSSDLKNVQLEPKIIKVQLQLKNFQSSTSVVTKSKLNCKILQV